MPNSPGSVNCRRFLNLLTVGVTTFLAIWGGGLLLALLWAPTSSPSRLGALIGSMFAVTGAVIAVVVWLARGFSD